MEIKEILKDLYSLDPSLHEREKELIKIIKQLIASRPNVKFSPEVMEHLRSELLLRIPKQQTFAWSRNFMKNKNLMFAMGAAIVLIIVVFPLSQFYMGRKRPPVNLTINQSITPVNSRAFGSLTETGKRSPEAAALGRGGGGGGVATTDNRMIVSPGEYTDYLFNYKGEPLNLSNQAVKVFKRELNGSWLNNTNQLVGQLNFKLINLSAFKNPQIQNLMVKENAEGGYEIALGLKDENASINRSMVFINTESNQQPLTINDVPSDEELIDIADKFLSKYGIDKKNYGAPEVDRNWQPIYLMAEKSGSEPGYIPSQINITFPLLIDGKQIYEEGGSKIGLTVTVSVRDKIVYGVYNIASQNYLSSDYISVTDTERIMRIVENGGFWNYHPENANKKVTLEVGTPREELVRIWRYKIDQSEEIYVPALVFPVINAPEGNYYYPRFITIPLAEELFEERWSQSSFNVPAAKDTEPAPGPDQEPLRNEIK